MAALPPVVALAALAVWRAHAGEANAQFPGYAAMKYDLDYSAWVPRDVPTMARVAWLNTSTLGWSLLQSTVLPPYDLLGRAARADSTQGDWPFAAFVAIGITVVVMLIVCGLLVTARRGGWVIHLYLAFYCATMLTWPFRLDRLTVPLFPFIQTLAIVGLWTLARVLSKVLNRAIWRDPENEEDGVHGAAGAHLPSDPPRAAAPSRDFAERLAFAGGAILCVHFLVFNQQVATSPKNAKLYAEREGAVAMIRQRTEADAVIAGGYRGYFFLSTGRKMVPVLPYDDPLEQYYPADRAYWAGGRRPSTGEIDSIERTLERRAVDSYRATGARYILLADYGGRETGAFARYFSGHRELFEVEADAGPYRIWRRIESIKPMPAPTSYTR